MFQSTQRTLIRVPTTLAWSSSNGAVPDRGASLTVEVGFDEWLEEDRAEELREKLITMWDHRFVANADGREGIANLLETLRIELLAVDAQATSAVVRLNDNLAYRIL